MLAEPDPAPLDEESPAEVELAETEPLEDGVPLSVPVPEPELAEDEAEIPVPALDVPEVPTPEALPDDEEAVALGPLSAVEAVAVEPEPVALDAPPHPTRADAAW